MSQASILVIRTLANIRADLELSYKPAVDSLLFHPPIPRADRRGQVEQSIAVINDKVLGPCERIKQTVFPYLTERETSQVEKVRHGIVKEAAACIERLEQALNTWKIQGLSERLSDIEIQMAPLEQLEQQERDGPLQQAEVEQEGASMEVFNTKSYSVSRSTTPASSVANIKVRRTKILDLAQSRTLDYSTKDSSQAPELALLKAKFEATKSVLDARLARSEVSHFQMIQTEPLRDLCSSRPNQIARKQVGYVTKACEAETDRTFEGRCLVNTVQPPPQPVRGYTSQCIPLPSAGSTSTTAQQTISRTGSSGQTQDLRSKISHPSLPISTGHPNARPGLTDSQVLNSNGAWEYEARNRGR